MPQSLVIGRAQDILWWEAETGGRALGTLGRGHDVAKGKVMRKWAVFLNRSKVPTAMECWCHMRGFLDDSTKDKIGFLPALRDVLSSTGLPSKWCAGIGFLSRADQEIGVFWWGRNSFNGKLWESLSKEHDYYSCHRPFSKVITLSRILEKLILT